jgi:hypothetical protein
MKTKYFGCILIIAVVFMITGTNISYSQNTPKFSVYVNHKSFSPGSSGIMTIKFKPDSKTHIPKEPKIDVSITGEGINGGDVQDYSSAPGGDYFTTPVVKYTFTVSSDLEGGRTVRVKGKVKFGYCDYESGICRIANKTFTLTLKIK